MNEDTLRETLLKSRIAIALIGVLRKEWPLPIDLSPSALGTEFHHDHYPFIEIIQSFTDEGLMMIDALLIGAASEPIARQAVLTRKGATLLFHVTRDM